jgi:hypothetical protein
VRIWLETTPADGAFFDPEHTFVPILFQIAFFLYPIEVIRPVKVEQCQSGIFPNISQAVMQGIIIVSVPRREG